MRRLVAVLLLALAACATRDLGARVERAYALAGENRAELVAGIETAPVEHRADVAFLVAQTGERACWPTWDHRIPDTTVATAALLQAHVRLAHEARRTFPWARLLDDETFRRFVLPYRMTTEKLADWRSAFWSHPGLQALVGPLVRQFDAAPDDRERDGAFRKLIHAINTAWVGTHVPYAPRGMPDCNPLEAIAQRTGRCTDQTNTLVAILRTFGIAATGVRVVWWPDANDNHTWTAVYNPVTREWMDVDSGQGGAVDDPAYFRRFVRPRDKRIAKVYWVAPGEPATLALKQNEAWPPAVEKYLVAKPMLDRTERYGDVADLERSGVPPDTLIWLAVRNSGVWKPVAGARSTLDGTVTFARAGCGVAYRLMTWSSAGPAYCSDILIPGTDGTVRAESADPRDDAALLEQRALQALQSGRVREGRDDLSQAVRLAPGKPDTLYNLACACALLGEKSAALDSLEQAVAAGWKNFAHLRADRDLDAIRGEERYKKLVEGR